MIEIVEDARLFRSSLGNFSRRTSARGGDLEMEHKSDT
jgi:hypothetical protein